MAKVDLKMKYRIEDLWQSYLTLVKSCVCGCGLHKKESRECSTSLFYKDKLLGDDQCKWTTQGRKRRN